MDVFIYCVTLLYLVRFIGNTFYIFNGGVPSDSKDRLVFFADYFVILTFSILGLYLSFNLQYMATEYLLNLQ